MTLCMYLSPSENIAFELPDSLLMVLPALAVSIYVGPIYSVNLLPMWPLLHLWVCSTLETVLSGYCDGSLLNRDLKKQNKKGRYSFSFCFKRKRGWIGVGWKRETPFSFLVAFSSEEVDGSNRSVLHFTFLDVFEDVICKSMYSILGFTY